MAEYIVIHGCVIEGKPAKIGERVELDDRIAGKLKALNNPRIADVGTPEADAVAIVQKPKRGRQKASEFDRAIGLPGTEDDMDYR